MRPGRRPSPDRAAPHPPTGGDRPGDHARRLDDAAVHLRRRFDAGTRGRDDRQRQRHRLHRRRDKARGPRAGGRRRHVLPDDPAQDATVRHDVDIRGRGSSPGGVYRLRGARTPAAREPVARDCVRRRGGRLVRADCAGAGEREVRRVAGARQGAGTASATGRAGRAGRRGGRARRPRQSRTASARVPAAPAHGTRRQPRGPGGAAAGIPDQRRRRADSIANGADDDGSGSVAALEIAERIASLKRKPKRSILFVWHTGEEKGLLGSRYFTDHPTVPRDSIVAQLNMDMVGRGAASDETGRTKDAAPLLGGPRYLQLVGSRRLSTELGDLVEAVNRAGRHGLAFDYAIDADGHPSNIYCRSDHYEYARYGIPITFFTTGLHSDYHQVSDEPEYIDYEHMARVANLVEDVALHV